MLFSNHRIARRVEGMMILRSAADAAAAGLSWRFIQDGEEYGIFGEDGEVLPRHYDDDGEPDGWDVLIPF